MIGWQVAAVCAGLVALGAALALVYVLWQTRPAELNRAPDPGSVRVFVDPADLTFAAVVIGAGAILSAGVAAWLIARRAVRPLEEAARIQQRFVADASHELRTPLAVLSARVQQLAMRTPADDPRSAIIEALREDARIMSGIVDDMLATATGGPPRQGSCGLAEVMTTATADLALLAQRHDVVIRCTPILAEIAIPADDLRRCLVALLDNAIDHSPAKETVDLSAVADRSFARITVTDSGSGISGIQPSRVFDRFAHGSSSREPREAVASGGESGPRTRNGIGLALVAELAQRHGGAVRVVRTGPTGTQFELTVPLVAGASR